MIEIRENAVPGVTVVRAEGTLRRGDYVRALAPLVEEARRSGERLRVLCEIGPAGIGVTAGALLEDVRLGLRALRLFDGCALVSDAGWAGTVGRGAAFMAPYPFRVFPTGRRDQALEWLTALPEPATARVRVRTDIGVVIVDVDAPLHAADLAAISDALDAWLAEHDRLPGLVLHAPAVPGWDTLTAMRRHLRLVRDHHRRIDRIALAIGGRLPAAGAPLANRIVHPELRTFGADRLDEAIRWAGGDPGGDALPGSSPTTGR